jgi:hypothetical protein
MAVFFLIFPALGGRNISGNYHHLKVIAYGDATVITANEIYIQDGVV